MKEYWNKFSNWIDKNLGYFLTNPANRWRWEERWKSNNSNNKTI